MSIETVTTKGTKKNAVAIATCTRADKLRVTINKVPLHLHHPKMIVDKVMELFTVLDEKFYEGLSFTVKSTGGGDVTRLYAARQAIAKALVAYYGKYVDEQIRQDIRTVLMKYDRSLLVADPRRKEAKKFGGPGARARYQKSYR
jgi:small subunit ribosomal protein S16e